MNIQNLLGAIPQTLKDELTEAYSNIETNYRESRWEPTELNGGKLCEIVYSILKGYVTGIYPAKAQKPGNIVDACKLLENNASSVPRSIRIQIPRMLIALYEIRNNRGVAHVGSDVNPNTMDALCILQMSKWIIAELIRIFHNVTPKEAEDAVETITQRKTPLIWEVNGKQRILDTSLSMKEKTLLLLYTSSRGLTEKDLVDFLEHSNSAVYRRDILKKIHKDKLIEHNANLKTAHISPKGIKYVEEKILNK